MGKQRTSRPQAFKATAAATSEIKAHVGENNPANGLRKSNASETQTPSSAKRFPHHQQRSVNQGVAKKSVRNDPHAPSTRIAELPSPGVWRGVGGEEDVLADSAPTAELPSPQ